MFESCRDTKALAEIEGRWANLRAGHLTDGRRRKSPREGSSCRQVQRSASVAIVASKCSNHGFLDPQDVPSHEALRLRRLAAEDGIVNLMMRAMSIQDIRQIEGHDIMSRCLRHSLAQPPHVFDEA